MTESYSTEAVLSLVDQGFNQGMKQAAAQAQKLQAQINQLKAGDSSFQKLSSGAKTVGNVMMGVGAATTAMGVKAATGFGTFQQSLNKAAVVAGGTSKDIGGLADVANRMGAELPLSAQDSADAMVQMAGAGASIGKIKSEFPAIAQAATATGDDLQNTASVVQNSMNIWGSSLQSPSQAAAILTKTANLSNASISDMQQALATIGGTASNAGISMQDTTEAIGLLTNKGFSAAQASQDLNHAIVQMQAPSSIAAKQMKALGLSFTDSNGKMKPMKQVLAETGKAMDGLKPAERTKALKAMFGSSGMAAILPLLSSVKDKTKDTSKSWDAYAASMNAAAKDGSTSSKYLASQAKEMQQNMGSKIEQVGGNWEALSNKAMAAKGGVTGSLLDMINKTLEWSSKSNSGIANVIRGFIGLAPVIGPAVTVLGGVTRSLGSIIKFGGAAGKALLSMGKGLVGLIAKLFGVGAAGETASAGEKAAGEGAKSSAKDMLAMGLAILEAGVGIAAVIASVGFLVFAIASLAKTGSSGLIALAAFAATVIVLAGVFALLGPALTASSAGLIAFGIAVAAAGAGVALFGVGILAIGAGIDLAAQGIMTLVKAFLLLAANVTAIVPTLAALGTGFATMANNLVTGLITVVPKVIALILTMITQILAQLAAAIPQMVASGVKIIVGLITGLAQGLPQIIAAVTLLIVNFLTALTAALPQIIAAGAQLIVSLLNGIAQAIPGIVTAAINLIVSFINAIASNLGQIINAGINLIASFLQGIVNAIPKLTAVAVQAVEEFVYGVGNALGQILASGSKLIQIFVKGIMSGLSGSKGAGKDNASAVKDGTSGISLLQNGIAIIGSFLEGLKSKYEEVKTFVSGIAGWIKDHKGPISYDAKLLVPAGQAIMQGLNSGLADGFSDVQSYVSGVAGNISSLMSTNVQPALNYDFSSIGSDFSNQLSQLNGLATANVSSDFSGAMTMQDTTLSQRNNALLRQIADKSDAIYLDGNTLVGHTYDRYDDALGNKVDMRGRWS